MSNDSGVTPTGNGHPEARRTAPSSARCGYVGDSVTDGLCVWCAGPRFGDRFVNTVASLDNPRRTATFVRIVRRTGRLNRGTWWEMTDGQGDFWLSNPVHMVVARG